jgi:hypothetical protein
MINSSTLIRFRWWIVGLHFAERFGFAPVLKESLLQFEGYGLQFEGYGLQFEGYGLQFEGYGLQPVRQPLF